MAEAPEQQRAGLVARLLRLVTTPAFVYLAASGVARLGTFALIPLYTRRLSTAAYGDYALAQTVISVLPTLLSLGLLSALSRAYFGEKDKEKGATALTEVAMWVMTLVFSLGGLLLLAVALFARPGHGGLTHTWELTCIIVAAGGSCINTIPVTFFRGAQRPFMAAAVQLGEFGVIAVSGWVLVGVLGRGVLGAIEAFGLAYAICGTVSTLYVLLRLRGSLKRSVLRTYLPFALPFVPHFLANWSQLAADRWVMKLHHLESSLGGYALAMQIASPAAMAAAAFHDAESARIGELFRAGGMVMIANERRRIVLRYVAAALVPAVFVLVAAPLASPILGPGFRSALSFLPLILGLVLLDTLYFPGSNVVYFGGRTRVIPIITVASAVVNIGANLILIPRLGVLGAVLARGLAYTTRSGATWYVARKCFSEAGTAPSPSPP